MGMTNKQFQGFIRLTIDKIKRALKESPDNQELKELLEYLLKTARSTCC